MCTWCTCAKIVKIKKKKSGYLVSNSILLSEEVTTKKCTKKCLFRVFAYCMILNLFFSEILFNTRKTSYKTKQRTACRITFKWGIRGLF